MASDKASLLKQRLRRGSGSFRFDALIEGVSTIEDPIAEDALVLEAQSTLEVVEIASPVEVLEAAEYGDPVAESPGYSVAQPDSQDRAGAAADTEHVRVRWAISTLAERFSRETAHFAAALAARDTESAGHHLAQVNQALELLQPLDPTGDLARDLHVEVSPPPGRSWPTAAWSLVEFAESPLSGLLPPSADERFVRDVLYRAWGVPASS